jgi:uncharacterized membrane protein YciS (DUF1049 family)
MIHFLEGLFCAWVSLPLLVLIFFRVSNRRIERRVKQAINYGNSMQGIHPGPKKEAVL